MRAQNNNHSNVKTNLGFYMAYFDLLKFSSTQIEAFNYLNKQVENITGKPKYKDFEDFKK